MVQQVRGGPCEAGVSVDYSSRHPEVLYCHKPGTFRPDFKWFGMVLCDDCYEMINQPELMGKGGEQWQRSDASPETGAA